MAAVAFKNSGMTVEELIVEHIIKHKTLTCICKERNISFGTSGLNAMSKALQEAGHVVGKRKITKGNFKDRTGVEWGELVGWYRARKPISVFCGVHDINIQQASIFMRLLKREGIYNTDPFRGFGFTQAELVVMFKDGMSISAIVRRFDLNNGSRRIISGILRGLGLVGNGMGRRSSGNSYISTDGYTRVLVTEDNKEFTGIILGGHELEHRLVIATSMGRPLEQSEWVHHINRDKSDNRLSNLMLVDKKTHKRVHTSMDKLIEELFKGGIAVCSKDGVYRTVETDDYYRGFSDAMEAMLEAE